MGLPKVNITFQTIAASFIQRTQNGIVSLILKSDTLTSDLYTYTSYDQVKEAWTDTQKAYIKMVFTGGAKKLYVARVGTTTPTLATALQTLDNKRSWNYLAYPEAATQDLTSIYTWIKTKRDTDKRIYKFIGTTTQDHEGIIALTTTDITTEDNVKYSSIQFTPRIAGIAAGVGVDSSLTNYALDEITSIKDLDDDVARNTAIDNGELILVNDGEDVVIARGVNSLKTTTDAKGNIFKKIRIIEIIDTIRQDLTSTINKKYKGKVLNFYQNKLLLCGAINAYFKDLSNLFILDPNFDNVCKIDLTAQKNYLRTQSVKVDDMSDQEILEYNTFDQVFLYCNIKTVDAAEDFTINIYL